MRFIHLLVVALGGGGALVAGCAGDRALVARMPLGDERVGFGYFSHSEGGGAQRNHRHYENFTLVKDSLVTGVRFWGLSDGTRFEDLANFDAFTVEIFGADASGAPGERIFSQTVSREEANPKATGRFGVGREGAGKGAETVCTVRFEAPVELRAQTVYFVAVTASRVDKVGDNWMWSDGQRDDGISYSWSYNQEQMVRIDDTDSALVILGRAK